MELREYAAQDAVGLSALVRNGDVSAAEVETTARRAIEAVEPQLSATVGELSEPAFPASDDGPFAGVPFALKEVAPHAEGQRTQLGSRLSGDGIVGAADTHLMQRFRAAGAAGSGSYPFARVRVQRDNGATCSRPDAEPVGSRALGRRFEWGCRGAGRRQGTADRARNRRRRVDPDPCIIVRAGRSQADALAHAGRPGSVGKPPRHGS